MVNETQNLLLQAKAAIEAKQYAKAEALQAQACKLMRDERADESRLTTELEQLADIHCIQNKFDQCASEYSEVVQTREKLLPANDFNILRPLYRLAKSHFEGQKYELAESEMRKALALAESRDDSPESLPFCLYELGWLLYFVGKYQEAESYLLQALPICETVHGASHPQTAQVWGAIALLYKNCPDLGKDPEPYFRRAIEASKSSANLRGCYLVNLGRLASFLDESKQFDDADGLYLELLSVIQGTPDQDASGHHWIVSDCVEYFTKRGREDLVADLAASAANRNVYGDIVKARLDHAEQTLSEDDPEFAEALSAAGNHALFEGNYQKAEPLLTRALDASRKVHGEASSQAVFALNRVGTIKRLLQKFDEAESAIREAIAVTKENAGDHAYARCLENLAFLREAESKFEDAERIYDEAISEYEKGCGFPSYVTAEALYHQSGFLLRMGKVTPAETAIRRAISVMDEVEELSSYEKSDYVVTLASILEATGRNSEAVELRNRADQLFEEGKKQSEGQS